MALVAYDNSDSSEYEDDDSENSHVVSLKENKVFPPSHKHNATPKPRQDTTLQNNTTNTETIESVPTLFNLLPQPSTKKAAVIEEDDEFLHKKAENNAIRSKAKITVPSLSDFKDVKDTIPSAKPKTASSTKSGLLSILPQPRNIVMTTTRSLIPHALTQKSNTIMAKKKEPLSVTQKKNKTESKTIVNDFSDESDNDDEVQNDFFSINKKVELPVIDIPLDIDQKPNITPTNISIEKKTPNIQSYFKQDVVENVDIQDSNTEQSTSEAGHSNGHGMENVNSTGGNDAELDDEAILKLIGARGKRKREEIQIVDVNQQEVLDNAREWLLKGLMDDTTKRLPSSKKKRNEPTNQQKRKHQITYLAHQAKANEAELQNQWANNRMSKRQTQSKYGF